MGDLVGFLGMLLIFLSVSLCSTTKAAEQQAFEQNQVNYTHFSPNLVHDEFYKNAPFKDQVCRHHSKILYLGAAMFFSYIGGKLLKRYKQKASIKKNKQKLKAN